MSKKGWIIALVIAIIEVVIGKWFILPHLLAEKSANSTLTVQESTTRIMLPTEGKPTEMLSTPTVGMALNTMANSPSEWDTLQGSAEFIWYTSEGGPIRYIKSFALQHYFKGRVVIKSLDGRGSECLWVSDGVNISIYSPRSQSYYRTTITDLPGNFNFDPSTLENTDDYDIDFISRYRFGEIIPSFLVDYLFPQHFADEGGNFTLIGENTFLERKVWVVDHELDTVSATLWVDQESGVVLKYIQYNEGVLYLQVTFMSFWVNQPIDSSLFVLPADEQEAKADFGHD